MQFLLETDKTVLSAKG